MKRTEELYGVSPNRYAKLQITLCTMKIQDASKLLEKLRPKFSLHDKSEEQQKLQRRIWNIQEAIEYNKRLIEEAEGII